MKLKTASYRSMKNKKIYQPDIFSFSNDSPKKDTEIDLIKDFEQWMGEEELKKRAPVIHIKPDNYNKYLK